MILCLNNSIDNPPKNNNIYKYIVKNKNFK